MKNFIHLFIVFCLVSTAKAQTQQEAWDSTYRPASYTLKVAQFESYEHSPGDVVFLGNSITAGTDWYELLQMPQARNRGISGDITFGVLQRLDEVIKGKPSKLFILIGINDISRNIPDSVIIANYAKIVRRVKAGSPKTKIFTESILPTNRSFDKFKNHYNKEAHIAAVNQGIQKIASSEGATYIDLHPTFADSAGNLDARLTYDGLHLNAEGYKRWAALLKSKGYLK